MAEPAAVEVPQEPGEPLTLQQAAARHGAYRWIEQRLFELTGAWSASPELPPALRVHLFEASAEHASHADRWFDRLPVLATVDRDALTRPLGRVLGPLVAELAGGRPGGPGDAGLRFVAGLYRVALPALLDSYRRHVARLSPVADEPSRRTVAGVVQAEEEELATATGLLGGLVSDPGRAALLERAAQDLSRALGRLRAGSEDLVPWSDRRCAW